MSTRKVSFPKAKHHARLIFGGVTPGKRVDFSFPVLGIKEARILREWGNRSSAGEDFNVYCGLITEEGQNALLKVLEEPAREVAFTFFVPRGVQLLPTLLSRLEVTDMEASRKEEDFAEIKKFINANFDSRLKIVAELIKKSEKLGENPKSSALRFLDTLEIYLSQVARSTVIRDDLIFALSEIRQCRVYLNDKSGTARLLLEYVAVVLP